MMQGSFRQPGGDVDELVDPDIGERILGRLQLASDVISSDIMKGRDVGLPPYNHYRQACGLTPAKKFKDLLGWMDRKQVEAIATYYEHPDDIDLMAAILAEKPMPGAVVGPTLACIMAEQLRYWRRSDRFWYEHSGQPTAFTQEQLFEIRKMSLAKLFCQQGDGVDAVQPRAFLIPGHGNEITDCKQFEMPNLTVFRDDRCYPHLLSHLHDHSSLHFTTQPLKTSPYLPVNLFRQKHLEVSPNDLIRALALDPRKPISPVDEYPNCKDCHFELLNGYPNPKASILYPNSDSKVNIYPFADPTIAESPKSEITSSTPRYLERNLAGDYPNMYPAVTNQNLNPFQPYFS